MTNQILALSREKHLDHMVKVVPFIVTAHLLQCYFILQMELTDFATDSLVVLSFGLVLMISGLVAYDLKHKVNFFEDHLEIEFLGKKEIFYKNIVVISVAEEEESFSSMTLVCEHNKKFTFYFVDNPSHLKNWILEQKLAATTKTAA